MSDTEQLVVQLEARIRDFEKNMQKAEKTASNSFSSMRNQSRSATKQMEQDAARSGSRISQAFSQIGGSIGAFGKAAGVAGIVATAAAAAAKEVWDVAKSVASVGDEAKRAGVSVEAFQALKYVAEQNRIGVDSLTDGIKELNLRADEFILTGKGSSAEAFQRLGYSAQDLSKKLKDPSELFAEIIGRLQQFDKAAQIRIADEIFGGTGGEKFVQLIDQGAAGIRATMKEAQDLGIIMDQDVIAKAAELDRRFNALATSVGNTLKSAIVSAADSLAEFIDGFRDFENQRTSTLQNKQTELSRKRLDLETQIREQIEAQRNAAGEQLSDVARNLGFEASSNVNLAGATGQIAGLREELEKTRAEAEKIDGILGNRTNAMTRTADRTWTPPVAPNTPTTPGAGRKDATSEIEREREAVKKLIENLEFENSLLGKSALEQEKMRALRNAGAAATVTQKDRIEELIEASAREKEAAEQVAEAMALQRDMIGGGMTDIRSALRDGKITADEWRDTWLNALDRVADKLQGDFLDAVLGVNSASSSSSGGLIGGLFSLFTGGGGTGGGSVGSNANGTNGWRGGLTMVGERGPELISLPTGSKVIPNHRMGQGGQSSMDIRLVWDADDGINAKIENAKGDIVKVTTAIQRAGLETYRRNNMASDVNRINKDPRRKG